MEEKHNSETYNRTKPHQETYWISEFFSVNGPYQYYYIPMCSNKNVHDWFWISQINYGFWLPIFDIKIENLIKGLRSGVSNIKIEKWSILYKDWEVEYLIKRFRLYLTVRVVWDELWPPWHSPDPLIVHCDWCSPLIGGDCITWHTSGLSLVGIIAN